MPEPVLLERGEREPQHDAPSPRARVAVALIALVVFAGGGYLAWLAFIPTGTSDSPGLGPGEVHRIRLDGPPQPTAAGLGATWTVVGTTQDDDVLWRIDGRTEEAKALPNTRGAGWPGVGEGFAWVTCTGKKNPCAGPSVLKLDPQSGETLATIAMPKSPFHISAGFGAVWVTMFEGGVARIDPLEERVTAVFDGFYGEVGTAGDSVWAMADDPDRVDRFDPNTGEVLDSVPLNSPCMFDASGDVVWIVTCSELLPDSRPTLTKIEAKTAEVILQVPIEVHGQMHAVGRTFWIASHPDQRSDVIQAVRLDPDNGEVVGEPIRIATGEIRFTSHDPGPSSPHVFWAADDRSLWLTDFGAGEIIRMGLTKDAVLGASHPEPSPVQVGSAKTATSICPALDESEDLPGTYVPVGRRGGGDVLGDGKASNVFIAADEARPIECRSFLVVEHPSGHVFRLQIEQPPGIPDVPVFLLSAELNGQPGLELIADFGGPGHPHRTGQLFTFERGVTAARGSLVRMSREPSDFVPAWLFPIGGEDPSGVDCSEEPGTIVVTTSSFANGGFDDSRFVITRTAYRARGSVFVEIGGETHKVEVGSEAERWPELADDPFRSCPDQHRRV